MMKLLKNLQGQGLRLAEASGFGTNLVITVATNLLLVFSSVLTGSLAARLLGPHGRGELAAIQIWPLFLATLGAVGLPQAMVYFVGKRPARVMRAVITNWLLLLPLSILWAGVGYWLMPSLLKSQSSVVVAEARLFLLIIPLAFFNSAHSALQGLSDFVGWNLFRISKPLLYLVLLIGVGLTGSASATLIARLFLLISAIPPFLLVGLLSRHGSLRRAAPDVGLVKPLLRYGIQTTLGTMPQMLNSRLDQLLMAALLPPGQLGLYTAAVSWSMGLGPIVSALGQVTFPRVASAKEEAEARQRFAQSLRLGTMMTVSIGLLMVAVTPVAVSILFGSHFTPAIPTAVVLTIAAVVWYLNQLLEAGLRGLGVPVATAWGEGVGLIVTGALLYVLLPRYQIMGAAIASLVAYGTTLVILIRFASGQTRLSLRDLFLLQPGDWERLRHIWKRMRTEATAD
ncbi:MAG: hypothetical protein E3J21_25330 [Anaerolineales bacterium]|nr:MAG: hypothetical protein E3J21_25330 [Anaerolineales bacterium]